MWIIWLSWILSNPKENFINFFQFIMSLLMALIAILFLSCAYFCSGAQGTVLSSSKTQQGVTVLVSVASAQGTVEHFSIDRVEEESGKAAAELKHPLKLSYRKSEVSLEYDLIYRGLFYAKAEELVGKPCLNRNEPYSSGFTCTCSIPPNDFTKVYSRGTPCTWGNLKPKTTRHCMQLSGQKYAAYSLSLSPRLDFSVSGALEYNNRLAWQWSLSPDKLEAVSADEGVTVRLEGDFSPYTASDSLSAHLLFIPQTTGMDHAVRNAMLVPRSEVTLDGSECNKIGTSFRAFHNQAAKCTSSARPGDCIYEKQLSDLHEEGASFASALLGSFELIPGGSIPGIFSKLSLKDQTERNSVVRFNIKGEVAEVTQVINVAGGALTDCKSGDILAFDGDRTTDLQCSLQNTGQLEAQFYLQVSCSEGILAVQQTSYSIAGGGSQKAFIPLHAHSISLSQQGCRVELLDSLGTILDEKVVNFKVSPQEERGNNPEAQEEPDSADFIFWAICAVVAVALTVAGLLFCKIGGLCKSKSWNKRRKKSRKKIRKKRRKTVKSGSEKGNHRRHSHRKDRSRSSYKSKQPLQSTRSKFSTPRHSICKTRQTILPSVPGLLSQPAQPTTICITTAKAETTKQNASWKTSNTPATCIRLPQNSQAPGASGI